MNHLPHRKMIPINLRGKDITIDVDINENVRADPAAISIAISKL